MKKSCYAIKQTKIEPQIFYFFFELIFFFYLHVWSNKDSRAKDKVCPLFRRSSWEKKINHMANKKKNKKTKRNT